MKQVFCGVCLLTALAASAHAGPVGICVLSSAAGGANNSSAEYATAVVTAGCNPGFFPSIIAGGTVSPASLGPGLTAATLTVTQTMPFGGTAIATSTADLAAGVLRDYSDTAGGVGGCGGTCTTTGGRAIAESLVGDNIHFTITDAAPSAIATFHAHLDGSITPEGTTGDNYNILDQFGLVGSGCWGSATGLGFQPCASGNGGYLTSSFTNQSATGFDFTGTFLVANGQTNSFFAALQVDCGGGTLCNFANTASFSLSLPSDVRYTSDSTVLFTASAPEPATYWVTTAALLGLGIFRRRAKRG